MLSRVSFIDATLRATADAVTRQASRRSGYTDLKGYLADADVLAHETIVASVDRAFPGEALLSEEGDRLESASSEALWICDPLCGTANYVRGIPLYTHALSFVQQGAVVAAGIYNPRLDEMFLAARGLATLNGRPIRVSEIDRLSEAVVAFNCNQSAPGQDRVLASLLSSLAPPKTRRIRVYESANLELAWVACGRIEAYLSPEDRAWDLAAGSLLVVEAGGAARPWSGSLAHPLQCRGVIASNGRLHSDVDRVLGESLQG